MGGSSASPSWDAIYAAANCAAILRGEWAGYPKLIPGHPLTVEPTHQWAKGGSCRVSIDDDPQEDDQEAEWTIVNQWFSEGKNATVYVLAGRSGQRRAFWVRDQGWPTRLLSMALPALGVANHFEWEAEDRAVQLLRGMVTEVQFNQYVITGSFLETSQRSGVLYLFRKGRPTVALGSSRSRESIAFLAALCLHPLAFYTGTWMGAMVPTDDVVAHLTLMRGDEPLFWRKANHHPAHAAAAGI